MSETQSFLKENGLPSSTIHWLLMLFILLTTAWRIPAIAIFGKDITGVIDNTSRFTEYRGRGSIVSTQSYLVKVAGKSYWLKSGRERFPGDEINFRVVPNHPDLQVIYWEWTYRSTLDTFFLILFVFGVFSGIWGKGKYA